MAEALFGALLRHGRDLTSGQDSSERIVAVTKTENVNPRSMPKLSRARLGLAAAFLAVFAGLAACAAPGEKSWRDRPSSYADYGGRPGVPSGGGP
jgi:hypothetical protein